MEQHEQRANEAERELRDMEERVGKLGTSIDDARSDWRRKQVDPNVPGAVGEAVEEERDVTAEDEPPVAGARDSEDDDQR